VHETLFAISTADHILHGFFRTSSYIPPFSAGLCSQLTLAGAPACSGRADAVRGRLHAVLARDAAFHQCRGEPGASPSAVEAESAAMSGAMTRAFSVRWIVSGCSRCCARVAAGLRWGSRVVSKFCLRARRGQEVVCVARLLGARGCHRYSRRLSKQPSALCTEAAQLLGTERSGPVRSRAGAAVTGHARTRHRQRRAAPKQARARDRAGGGRRDPGPGARGRWPGRVHGARGGARGCARPAACCASRGLPAMPSAPSRPTPPWRELALYPGRRARGGCPPAELRRACALAASAAGRGPRACPGPRSSSA